LRATRTHFSYSISFLVFSSSHLQLFFHKAVQNDTLFLSIINVVDYSILAGFDENSHEVVVGIIDYMRQVSAACLCLRDGGGDGGYSGCDVND